MVRWAIHETCSNLHSGASAWEKLFALRQSLALFGFPLMIHLADTSIRMYRKRDGLFSLRLRSYLMINTNLGFRLSAYLKSISLELSLPNGDSLKLDSISWTYDSDYEMETMVHGFWASGATSMDITKFTVAKLKVHYHLSFTGHPTERPTAFEVMVPLIDRT